MQKLFLAKETALSYSLYFLFLIFSTYCFVTIGFIAGVSISPFYFPLALIVCGSLFFLRMKQQFNLSAALGHLLFVHLFLLVSYLIVIHILDTSYDGLWYHEPAIIKLKNGWNPLLQPFYNINQYDQSNYLWIQHYPKAIWTISACIYKMSGLVESGKMINFLFIAAVFFYSYHVFSAFFVKLWHIIIFSLLISFNPVVTDQLLSNYIDGEVCGCISLIVLALLNMQLAGKRSEWDWAILLIALILITNIKFTGLFIAGIIIAGISVYWWWKKVSLKVIIKKYTLIFIVAATALLLFGFNPYFTNWHNRGYIFYPLNKPAQYAIVTNNEPVELYYKSNFEKIMISVFAQPGNDMEERKVIWRSPFYISKAQLRIYTGTDVRIGGFGPLFALALLLSLLSAIVFFKKIKRDNKILLVIFSTALFVSVLFTPMGWWARYAPQLFLIPLLLTAFVMNAANDESSKVKRFVPLATVFTLCINLFLITGIYITSNIIKTNIIKDEMKVLKRRKGNLLINFTNTELQGVRKRLEEAHVQFTDSDTLQHNTQELRSIYNFFNHGPVYNKLP